MSATEELLQAKTGTVYFEVKRQIKSQYEPDVVGIYVPYEFSTNHEELEARISDALATAKAVAYTQVGADWKYDEFGYVREVGVTPSPAQATADAFGGEVVQSASQPAQGQQNARPSSGFKVWKRILDPDRVGEQDERGNPIKLANPPWFAAQVAKANERNGTNETEFWDNRGNLPQYGGTGSPKAAWFVGKENREVKVWPPS